MIKAKTIQSALAKISKELSLYTSSNKKLLEAKKVFADYVDAQVFLDSSINTLGKIIQSEDEDAI